jgi:hypothetical protein
MRKQFLTKIIEFYPTRLCDIYFAYKPKDASGVIVRYVLEDYTTSYKIPLVAY